MNKKTFFATLITLASIASLPALATDKHAGHGRAQATSEKMQMVDGQVKKIDKATSKVTLAHGPLIHLNMPAMTMAFKVPQAAWLDQMKPGSNIRFVADNVNGVMTIVHFQTVR